MKTTLWKSKQGERNVIDYYNEMRAFWRELYLCYEETWECKNDSIKYHKHVENDRVYVFLVGLYLSVKFLHKKRRGRRRVMLSGKPVPAIEVSAPVSKNTTTNQQPRQWQKGERSKV